MSSASATLAFEGLDMADESALTPITHTADLLRCPPKMPPAERSGDVPIYHCAQH
jgi:hypothetical protein